MELTPSQSQQITEVEREVKKILSDSEAGHDWWHIQRVYSCAQRICQVEKGNQFVIYLAALLHDIADSKFHDGDESIGPELAQKIMTAYEVDTDVQNHVIQIIRHMSFKNSFGKQEFTSREMKIVQDADRLDAIGAIGIARAFSYGGYKGRVFMDPSIAPISHVDKSSYTKSTAPTINHFYEKLLLLKDQMHSEYAKQLAEERHQFMLLYLNQFYNCLLYTSPSPRD